MARHTLFELARDGGHLAPVDSDCRQGQIVSDPWVNHSWQVPLYVTARGLGTSPIPFGTEIVEVEFDFIDHRLLACTSRGDERAIALEPASVADFYSRALEL